jgi:indoleamine 2,3-dioxygenase
LPQRLAVRGTPSLPSSNALSVLSYTSYALHNFVRFDASRDIECGNIALIQNFLGGLDEEWFILIHVDIERKAAPGVAALHDCLDAAEAGDAERRGGPPPEVRVSIASMYAVLKRMPESCDPYIYYHRVRPYIHGWKNHPDLPEGLMYEGVDEYGGRRNSSEGKRARRAQSFRRWDAFLGIHHKQDQLRTYLMEMRTYMPPEHRQFIGSWSSAAPCGLSSNTVAVPRLTEVYNACIEGVGLFRSLHLEYASRYIFRQAQTDDKNPHAVGTGGTPFMPYLTKHRDETEQHRL